MEDGTAARAGGSNGKPRDRRRTVSGAIPQSQDERKDVVTPIEKMRFPWSSPSAPTSPTRSTAPPPPSSPKSSGRKRAFSGGFLSKFSLLRNSGSEFGRPLSRDKAPPSPTKSLFSRKSESVEDDAPPSSPTSPKAEKEGALVSALKHSKTRKRKGSLRKTALLGGRRSMTEGRERKGSLSLLHKSASTKSAHQYQHIVQQVATVPQDDLPPEVDLLEDTSEKSETASSASSPQSVRRQFSYENVDGAHSSDSGWSASEPTARLLTIRTDHHQKQASLNDDQENKIDELDSPLDVKSPTSQTSYTSNSDEGDLMLSFDRPAKQTLQHAQPQTSAPNMSLGSKTTSYFPSSPNPSSLSIRRRISAKRSSPLSRTTISPSSYPSDPPPHDYTETEYWGWILLFTTWLTFTVGMGSCLGIWSWAWDVGERPRAPRELEDDDSLPIVGYYPALMVLTGVVSWVWITVAWVGMKYFRHAKIEV